MKKPLVSILSTGGTIAGVRDPITHAVKSVYSTKELLYLFPEINDIATIKSNPPIMSKLSEDLTPDDWVTIAEAIEKELADGVDGIVVTHGTFTMGYTSAALSFIFRNIQKPIILTGAQVPIFENANHVKSNLLNSIYFAGNSNLPGIYIIFAGDESSAFSYIYRSTRTRKCFAWKIDCFRSIGIPPFGLIKNNEINYFNENISENGLFENDKSIITKKFNDNVGVLKSYPGIQPDCVDQLIDKGHKGIILEGYADGSFPTNDIFINSLFRAKEKEIPVFAVSQAFGQVTLSEYFSGKKMLEAGVVPLGDMIFETALVKLMWILGNTENYDEIITKMKTNIVGEINDDVN